MTHPHFYEITEQYKGDQRHFNSYHLTFSWRLKCWMAYSRLPTRICCRKYNDLMLINIIRIPNVCKIHNDRNRRQRSKCWWFLLSLNLTKVKMKIFIRSGNHTAQIYNLVCPRFNYSKNLLFMWNLTKVDPLAYALFYIQ